MTEQKEPTTTYGEVQISYNEDKDRWEFELRGVSRFAKTLTLAKRAIDKPISEGKKPFERMEAYRNKRYASDSVEKVIVTGIAERSYGQVYVWISIPSEKPGVRADREKVSISQLYAVNPVNDYLFEDIRNLERRIDDLEKEKAGHYGKLEPFRLPENVDTGEESA